MKTENNSTLLHYHIGAYAHVWVDEQHIGIHQLTIKLLFDIEHQREQYARIYQVRPILLPLVSISEEDLQTAAKLGGFDAKKARPDLGVWKCYGAEVFDFLVKKYDVFGLLKAGFAVHASFVPE